MIVAYLRVSTGKQLLENQKNEISAFAQNRNMVIDQWVTEIASGCKQRNDRKLGTLLRRMKKGDSLIVTELSRLSRTLIDIMTIMGTLLQKGVVLYSTKERYSFDNSLNSKVLCFAFGLVAEIERNLISMRTREALALRRAEGMALALRREQGVKLGRKKGSYTKQKILLDNRNEIIRTINSGQSIASICRKYHVSRETFNRFRRNHLPLDKKDSDITKDRYRTMTP